MYDAFKFVTAGRIRLGSQIGAPMCVALATMLFTGINANAQHSALHQEIESVIEGSRVEGPETEGWEDVGNGMKRRPLKDGGFEFVRNDGTRFMQLKDGTMVTVRRDGTRTIQKPNEKPQSVKTEGSEELRPHVRKDKPELEQSNTGNESGERRRQPKFEDYQTTDVTPKSVGKHADWREFENFVAENEAREQAAQGRTSNNSSTASAGGSATIIMDERLSDGRIRSQRSDGSQDFISSNGIIQRQFPDKTVVTTYPNSDTAAIQTPDGKVAYGTRGDDGTVYYKNDKSGESVAISLSGIRISENGGSKDVRDIAGKAVMSEYQDQSSGYKITQTRVNGQDVAVIRNGNGDIVGNGRVENGRMVPRDLEGKPLRTNEIFDAQSAGRSRNSAGQTIAQSPQLNPNDPNSTGRPKNIFEIASDQYQKQRDNLNVRRGELEKQRENLTQTLQSSPNSGNAAAQRNQFEQNLAAFNQLRKQLLLQQQILEMQKEWKESQNNQRADATQAQKSDKDDPTKDPKAQQKLLEEAKRRADCLARLDQLKQESAKLESEKSTLSRQEMQLNVERRQWETKDRQIKSDEDSIDSQKASMSNEKFTNDLERQKLEAEKRDLERMWRSIEQRLDYTRFRCSAGLDYWKCEAHPNEKEAWKKAEIERLLGKATLDRFAAFNRKADYLDARQERYDDKMKALDDQLRQLRSQRKDLQSSNSQLKSRLDDYRSKVDTLSKSASQLQTKITDAQACSQK